MNIPQNTLIGIVLLAVGAGFALGVGVGGVPGFWFRKRVRYLDHVIEIRNNLFGWETVMLDEQMVVSQFAFGGTYKFMIGSDQAEVRMRLKWHMLSLRIQFRVNEKTYYEE